MTKIFVLLCLLIFVSRISFSAEIEASRSTSALAAPVPAASAVPSNSTTVNPIVEKRTYPDWSVSYFNISSNDLSVVNYGGASWSIYQYFSINRILDLDSRYSLRIPFILQTSGAYSPKGETRQFTTFPADLHAAYSNYNLASLGDWKLMGTFYLYLPTTEFSQVKGWTARTSAWMILENKINDKWLLTYNGKPDYYWLTQKAFRSEKTFPNADGTTNTVGVPDANLMARLDHYFELSRSMSPSFIAQLDLGVIHEWYADSQWVSNKPLISERLKVAPNAKVTVNKSLSFIVGLEDKIDLRTPRKDFSLFREEETTYYFMTFLSIL